MRFDHDDCVYLSPAEREPSVVIHHAVRRLLRGQRARLGLLRGLSLACAAGFQINPAMAELPVICVSGATCGNSSAVINNAVSSGTTVTTTGNAMTVNQSTATAVLNWQSFNISSGSSVTFVQPDSSSVALNRIYQSSASQILGSLTANGRVYLINQNGILFGNGAVVNVAGLIASSLDISSYALKFDDAGEVSETDLTAAGFSGKAAFKLFDNGNASGDVTVGQGATITTSDGGQVFLFAPNVYNHGTITTPGGQTVLAAGDSVYLASSTDSNLRGVWVEVGTGGTVCNGDAAGCAGGTSTNASITDTTQLVGQIIAERGNITLAGAAVNQYGRLTATTSVNENGSIRLVARDRGSVYSAADSVTLTASNGGNLTLGQNSVTEVQLDDSGETTVDSNEQPVSQVVLLGNRIVLQDSASIIAPHGDVTLAACSDCREIIDTKLSSTAALASSISSLSSSNARIYLADNALIDVSGVDINKTMESNVIAVELRADELADSELQLNGALRGETVYVDIRQSGTNEDGTEWVGSPIGDLSGWVSGIEKTVDERSLTGGSVTLLSQGDVIVDKGSTVDISGGSITYASGYINTSTVLGADGKIYDISAADPDRVYTTVLSGDAQVVTDQRWGVTKIYQGNSLGVYEEGYVEGKDAGTLTILAPKIVLDGSVVAETQAGRYQRNLSSEFDVTDATALYRPYDELPLAGTLILGKTSASGSEPDYVLSDVEIGSSDATLSDDFDPLVDVLPDSYTTLKLNTELFGEDKIGNLVLRANGTVTVNDDATLMLPAGGTLDVAAGAVTVAGDVISHGGSVTLTSKPTLTTPALAGGLVLSAGATLDVSGVWVNDQLSATQGVVSSVPLAIDGGSVTLTASENSLTLEAGSRIDVSAGAQLTVDGDLNTGSAGSITLSNTPNSTSGEATTLALEGVLSAYGFDQGGSLTISTGAVCISDDQASCEDSSEAGLLWLQPEFFATQGFGSYALTSIQGGIEVTAGTQVVLQQQNLVVDQMLTQAVSGTAITDLTEIALLSEVERQAVDLSLTVAPSLAGGQAYNSGSFAAAGSLVIGTDAALLGDVGADISLSSSTRLLVDGTVSAAAGNISLTLTSNLNLTTDASADVYFEDQGIWLGSNAQLLARGAVLSEIDTLGRNVGEVLAGGSISIDADRGHVLTSAGSLIDVSGTAAQLDIKSDAEGHYTSTLVGSAGGSLAIEAAEAIVIGGDIAGESGDPGTLAGGSLSITLDASNRNDPGQIRNDAAAVASAFPTNDLTIEVTQEQVTTVFANSILPDSYQGKALVSAEQLMSSGFDAVSLSAQTFWTKEATNSPNSIHVGTIAFAGDVALSLARSLTLDAAVFTSDGGDVELAAPVVTLGNSLLSNGEQVVAETVAGNGSLLVEAGQIDLVGSSVLQGFAAATLQSSGDLRLQGVLNDDGDALLGSFSTAGDLTLSAAQVYPTTLTDFTVTAGADSDTGVLRITQNGEAGDALSAGGTVTLIAPTVVQEGTVRAPFGTINIESPNITLAAGSVTSTSGEGLTVLYGETQGGIDWVYVLGSGSTIVYGDAGESLTSQAINLTGDNVTLAEGSTLDVSGGGTLLATEFESGVTGTLDILGADNTSGSFAILPASALASAAFDYSIYSEAEFSAGKSIYLSGSGDLPAGEYIILPAKYALLPNAYLVTPVSGYQDITAGETISLTDGSVVVSGYYTYTGSGLRDDARTSGFAVLKGTEIQAKATYTLTSADEFFAAQSESATLNSQRLPMDAGVIAIVANDSLTLQGDIEAQAAEGGRGAALDISSSAIVVTTDVNSVSSSDALVLNADDLNALGVESLLLGGVRSTTDEGISIATVSSNVTIQSGASLSGSEVMLVATDKVTVQQGASITASGDEVATNAIALSGDGAFLRVATAEAATVTRSGVTANDGQVVLAEGALLRAENGSIGLESSGTALLAGTLDATGGEVSLTGSTISVGEVDDTVTGWVLDAAQLSALDASTLTLHASNAIDWYGAVQLTLENLNLATGLMRGNDADVSIVASGDVTLTGVETSVSSTSATSSGEFNISSDNITLLGGDLSLQGFATTNLSAAHELRAEQDAALTVAGVLNVAAQRISTASGVDLSIAADGAVVLGNSGATEALATLTDLGGSLTVTAATVELATTIELPSGVVSLTSTSDSGGGITLTEDASIDVSGRSTEFGDSLVDSSGGSVTLATLSGDVVLASGSRINVDAAGSAAAGSIELSAVNGALSVAGQLSGNALSAYDGGSLTADAQNLGDFAALTQTILAGGLTGELSLRQRGDGDLTVAADTTLTGTSVKLTADQGSIVVAGNIEAHDTDGGRISLAASEGMLISGTLDAAATSSDERNGRISLSVTEGGLIVTDTAVLATVGASAAEGTAGDGVVSIRLPQAQLLTVLDANTSNDTVRLAGDFSHNDSVSIEGFKVYTDADGVLDDADVSVDSSSYYADAATFAAQTNAIAAALLNSSMPNLAVVTGIEIQSGLDDGSLSLVSDWNLADWRFNGEAGVLTLRASGDLVISQSLSDGFSSVDDFTLDLNFGDSWSYNLVAGADTGSADVLATRSVLENTAGSGSLTIVGGDDSSSTDNYTVVRTGTGDINIAAALDVVLSNDAAMIYTAGVASDGMLYRTGRGLGNQLGGLYYPTDGGDISISAGRDVVGAVTDQLVTEWLWRIGNTDSTTTRSTAWTVSFADFHQGVGALGGGDVVVNAGRDVTDLSVSVPSIGRQATNASNNKTAAANDLEIIGGGNVVVSAGRDINGGSYYAGLGSIELTAADSVGASEQSGLSPILALGDATAVVTSRQDLDIAAVVNPTLLPQSSSQGSKDSTSSIFSTYSDASGVTLQTTAGDISLGTDKQAIRSAYGWDADGLTAQTNVVLSLLPGTVELLALRGAADVSGTLLPTATGYLSVQAYDDVNFNVIVSDVAAANIPSVERPVIQSGFIDSTSDDIYTALTSWDGVAEVNDVFNADTPVRLAAAEAGTLQASLIVSATGDVSGAGYFGGPLSLYAGNDVTDLNVLIQNLVDGDVSSITAGNDIVYTLSRGLKGGVLTNSIGITIDGPGQLLLTAGGNLNLGASDGVISRGNQVNTALSDTGAGITVLAGLNGETPDYATFINLYLEQVSTYTDALLDYLEQMTGSRPGNQAAAVTAFNQMNTAQQRVFLYRVLLAELRASAEEAASTENAGDYSRGFTALEALFPGSTSADNPYLGDILLYFSRIYTLDGGDINLLAPGGEVNVGLATPPSGFGITKTASELGLVSRSGGNIGILADQDVSVNESRIFAVNNSDIVVWSSNGDIDAGRGAKTAISAPAPVITYDNDGRAYVTYSAALSGSGIQTRATTDDYAAGDVVLAAPRGVVNAGDAGIVAGNLTIAATAVLGADNIKVSGVAVGVPVDTGGLGASLAGVAAAASGASSSADAAVEATGSAQTEQAAPLAAEALSWLEVFVVGLGEDNCKQDDLECLKRQK